MALDRSNTPVSLENTQDSAIALFGEGLLDAFRKPLQGVSQLIGRDVQLPRDEDARSGGFARSAGELLGNAVIFYSAAAVFRGCGNAAAPIAGGVLGFLEPVRNNSSGARLANATRGAVTMAIIERMPGALAKRGFGTGGVLGDTLNFAYAGGVAGALDTNVHSLIQDGRPAGWANTFAGATSFAAVGAAFHAGGVGCTRLFRRRTLRAVPSQEPNAGAASDLQPGGQRTSRLTNDRESLGGFFDGAEQLSSETAIAIPQFTADQFAVQRPSLILADRKQGLGAFYLRGRQSVVTVIGDHPSGATAVGSGFFVRSDGTFVTNNHCVSGLDRLRIETADGNRYWVRIVGRDRIADVAVGEVLNRPPEVSFPSLTLADSSNVSHNAFVCSIGHPSGVRHQVLSMGQYKGFALEAETAPTGRAFDPTPRVGNLVTNMPVKPGYSGSPLMTDRGIVVGVVKAEQNIGLTPRDTRIQANGELPLPAADEIRVSLSTRVEHLNALLREIQTQPPVRGWLDVSTVYDTAFGAPRVYRTRVQEMVQWPIDGVSGNNSRTAQRWFSFDDDVLRMLPAATTKTA